MSTNLNYKQVANVSRRTWDVEAYEDRAQERSREDGKPDKKRRRKTAVEDNPGSAASEETKEEFVPAIKGAAGPEKSERAFLKSRRSRVDVDSKVGSVEIVNPNAGATTKSKVGETGSIKDGVTKTGVGWHCSVCDCFLRDSHTYLDHINGRKHQRNLGYSMRVERSSQDQVKSRLAMLAKEKTNETEMLEENFHDVVKAKDEEARKRKEERARQRKERRKKKEPEEDPAEETQENGEAEEEINPDLAAMMGFSGFGGGK